MRQRRDFSRAPARRGTARTLSRRLVAAAFLPALALAALPATPAAAVSATNISASAEAGPALWVIQDTDTTIYLFGTFHALDGRSNWFTHNIRAAFEASDQLVLETLVPEDPAELHAVLGRHTSARDPKAGEPVYADRGASSFVASAGQAMSAGKSMGMSVDQGADAVLRRAAEAGGKPVAGLESFEFQLNMFASLPATPAHRATGNLASLMTGMQSAWKRGDNDDFAAILGNIRVQSPQTYKTLFADRNANWAGWIADRLAQPGTVFVAVGTGHLVGPDSVQSQLASRGITSARIS